MLGLVHPVSALFTPRVAAAVLFSPVLRTPTEPPTEPDAATRMSAAVR
ncbi:hypothetical protein [Streptomyces longispororuber]